MTDAPIVTREQELEQELRRVQADYDTLKNTAARQQIELEATAALRSAVVKGASLELVFTSSWSGRKYRGRAVWLGGGFQIHHHLDDEDRHHSRCNHFPEALLDLLKALP